MTDRVERWLGSDRATRALAVLTLVFVVVVMVAAGLTVPQIVSNTEASRRTDNLASCRAAYAAKSDQARDKVLATHGDVLSGVGTAVVNAIRQDPVALEAIAEQLVEYERARAEATADLVDASNAYADAVLLSQENPGAFLAECSAIQ